MNTRIPLFGALIALATMALVTAAAAAPVVDTLPGGTAISIENTSPQDGDQFLIPLGDATTDIDDSGTATVGGGAVLKDTSIVYVIDVSGSTGFINSGVDCDGLPPATDFVLVCEKVGALSANTAASAATSVVKNSAVVSFASSATIVQGLTTDFGAIATAINGLSSNGGTFYPAAVAAAKTVLIGAETNRIVIFLSDGFSGASLAAVPDFAGNTIVQAFAIGDPAAVRCDASPGSDLNAVAALGVAGSSCQQVTDPSLLGDLITSAVGSSLDALSITVDGNTTAIPGTDIDLALPAGPSFASKTANWTTPMTNLGPGFHDICVEATGSDAGGSGSVQDCKQIQLLQIQVDGPGLEATNELGVDGEHTVSVDIAGDVGGTAVVFAVTGVNPGGDTVLTDGDGKASFIFTSPQDPSGLGDDTIEVTITIGGVDQKLTFTKHWVDTTAPSAACLPSVNPSGNQPSAPGNGGQGQNQDGFYELDGADDIWPSDSLTVYVVDSGSGTHFGPYSVGDVIKYTEDDDAVPEAKKMGGKKSAVTAHIIGNGDGVVHVVDGSGNVSAGAYCLVPPAPK